LVDETVKILKKLAKWIIPIIQKFKLPNLLCLRQFRLAQASRLQVMLINILYRIEHRIA
jgi:hypothetical protein